jgi:hypothetical protein
MRLRTFAVVMIAGGLLGSTATIASAQLVTLVRVVNEGAVIMTRPSARAEVLAATPAQTVLETLDKMGTWYWVLLNRDGNGTRRAGWIREGDVEIESATGLLPPVADASADVPVSAEHPIAEVKAAKPNKKDEAAFKKAERELEKALRDFEKLTQTAAIGTMIREGSIETTVSLGLLPTYAPVTSAEAPVTAARRIAETQAAKPNKKDDAALKKAERDLEKARREFEKLTQPTTTTPTSPQP